MMKLKHISALFLVSLSVLLFSCNEESDIYPAQDYLGKWELADIEVHVYVDGEYDNVFSIGAQNELLEFKASGQYDDPDYALIGSWHRVVDSIPPYVNLNTWELLSFRYRMLLNREVTDCAIELDVTGDTMTIWYYDTLKAGSLTFEENMIYAQEQGEYYGGIDGYNASEPEFTGYELGYEFGYRFGLTDGYYENAPLEGYDLLRAYFTGYAVTYWEKYQEFDEYVEADFEDGHWDGYNDAYSITQNYAISLLGPKQKRYTLVYKYKRL